MFSQRRWDAEDDGVLPGQLSEVRGSREVLATRSLYVGFRDPEDIRAASLEVVDLPLIDVEARHLESSLREEQGKRQPDITKTDHANRRGMGAKPLKSFGGQVREGRRIKRQHIGFDYCIVDSGSGGLQEPASAAKVSTPYPL